VVLFFVLGLLLSWFVDDLIVLLFPVTGHQAKLAMNKWRIKCKGTEFSCYRECNVLHIL